MTTKHKHDLFDGSLEVYTGATEVCEITWWLTFLMFIFIEGFLLLIKSFSIFFYSIFLQKAPVDVEDACRSK